MTDGDEKRWKQRLRELAKHKPEKEPPPRDPIRRKDQQ
jgi:hypothetical protein